MGRWQDAIGHYDEAERLDPKNAINVGNSAQPLAYLRRCGEARQAVDRTLALAPDNLSRVRQKLNFLVCDGDVAAARALVADTARRTGPADTAAYLAGGLEWLLDAETFALLRRLTPAAFDNEEAVWANAQTWAAWRAGDMAAARTYAEQAIPYYEELARSSPKFPGPHQVLGPLFAFAGKKAEAVREAVRATELDPVATSPWSGAEAMAVLAQTYMIVGETDKAIDMLERLLKIPYYLTPAWLAVDPTYDSLRQNPRFQKLVAGK